MNRESSMSEGFDRLYGSLRRFNAAARPEKPKCPCGMHDLEDVTPPYKGTLQQSVAAMHEEECKTSVLRSTLFKAGFCNISRTFNKSNFERLGVEVRKEKTLEKRGVMGSHLFLDELWVPFWVPIALSLDPRKSRKQRDRFVKRLAEDAEIKSALSAIAETSNRVDRHVPTKAYLWSLLCQ